MREICMSGSMSGVWRRSHGRTSEAPPNERGGNRYVRPTVTAPHLDSTNDQTVLSLAGIINNTGTINLDQESTSGSTQLRLASQTVTLTGVGGKVTMSNNGLNEIFGYGGGYGYNRLINVNNTISGAGQLGVGSLTLVNQAAGVINANQAAGLLVAGQLILNTSNSILTNAGLLESTNTGGLLIQNTAVNNAGGTVLATGASSFVDLGASTIQGGTLLTAAGGTIETVSASGLDGITNGVLNNKGIVLVNSQTRLDLAGVINNTGTINVDQEGNSGSTSIRLTSQEVTLTGTGKVLLSPNALNQIYSSSGSNTLINVNNTIAGAGQLGAGQLTLVNQAAGNINANQAVALTLNTGSNLDTNTGTLQDTGTGGLVIQSTAVNNAGGTIQAAGAGAHVDLVSAYIEGGILKTSGGGMIQTLDRGSALDGITSGILNNQGTIQIVDNTSLGLVGTINNTGSIIAASAGSNTEVRVNSQTVTLQGGGKLVMSNNVNNRIFTNNTDFKLVNVNDVISGAGQIGAGTALSLVNQSLINAYQSAALIVNTGAALAVNTGTMQATGTVVLNGGLVLQSTVNNAGGTIQALGPLAHVNLDGGYIEGGTLNTTGGALIMTVSTGSLDGITTGAVTNKGSVLVNDHATLNLYGTINNTGTIKENATSGTGNTDIRVGGQKVILSGAGQFVMTDNPNNRVYGSSATNTLINQGNTIRGAGQFGVGQMEFINQSGTVQATGGNALLVNLGSGNGVNGAGAFMLATGAGGMVLASGIFTNNVVMEADDGSSFTFQSAAVNTNLNEGDLVGGSWRAVAVGHGATLSMTGGPIVTDAAFIVLSGAGSVVQAGSGSGGTPYTPLEQTLTTIAATTTTGGWLKVLAGRGYSSPENLSDNGTVLLQGGTFQTASLIVGGGGLLQGYGTVNDAPANNGKIEALPRPVEGHRQHQRNRQPADRQRGDAGTRRCVGRDRALRPRCGRHAEVRHLDQLHRRHRRPHPRRRHRSRRHHGCDQGHVEYNPRQADHHVRGQYPGLYGRGSGHRPHVEPLRHQQRWRHRHQPHAGDRSRYRQHCPGRSVRRLVNRCWESDHQFRRHRSELERRHQQLQHRHQLDPGNRAECRHGRRHHAGQRRGRLLDRQHDGHADHGCNRRAGGRRRHVRGDQ
jgi:hypothetical protein